MIWPLPNKGEQGIFGELAGHLAEVLRRQVLETDRGPVEDVPIQLVDLIGIQLGNPLAPQAVLHLEAEGGEFLAGAADRAPFGQPTCDK